MGQIVSSAAKPKRCNLNKLSQLETPAAGEYILVSYDNSMTANGQGNFDRYIIGDGRTAATALELKYLDDSTRPYIVEEVNKAVADIQPIEITGDVTNAPDEEDLTSEKQGNTDVLKFKDKAYNSALYSGLGRVYLRKNLVTLEGVGKNVLTQAMVNTANTIYRIQYDYDLNGQTITLPAGCVLEFDGGSLTNGVLIGDLRCAKGFLELRDIGVVYNDAAKGEHNVDCLSILSGITNEINITLFGDVYLSGALTSSINSLHVDGNGHTLTLLGGFDGIKINKDFTIVNTKVQSDRNSDTSAVLAVINNVESNSNITVCNNIFIGNLRVITCSKVAHENSDGYKIDNFIIKNNTFNDMHYTSGASCTFNFKNAYLKNVEICNNYIHNFVTLFFDLTIENGTIYETLLNNNDRIVRIEGNHVENDIDYKPWEQWPNNIPSYFCFVALEGGKCICKNNLFKNIIGNSASTPVYDNYLSARELLYSNNYWENCLSINPNNTLNGLMKSKAGTRRIYENNTYITTDLSSYFSGYDLSNIRVHIVDTQVTFENYTIKNNVYELYSVFISIYILFRVKKAVIDGNTFTIERLSNTSATNSFFGVPTAVGDWQICNNIINIANLNDARKGLPCICGFGGTAITKKSLINIHHNKLYNAIPLFVDLSDSGFLCSLILDANIIFVDKNPNKGHFLSFTSNTGIANSVLDIKNDSSSFISPIFTITKAFNADENRITTYRAKIGYETNYGELRLFGPSTYANSGVYRVTINGYKDASPIRSEILIKNENRVLSYKYINQSGTLVDFGAGGFFYNFDSSTHTGREPLSCDSSNNIRFAYLPTDKNTYFDLIIEIETGATEDLKYSVETTANNSQSN